MSQRGSYCTEYIDCKHCFEVAKEILLSKDKYNCSTVLPGYNANEPELPIIAGKIGGMGDEAEFMEMEELIEKLEDRICHPLRLSVISEISGMKFYTVTPLSTRLVLKKPTNE